MLEPDCAFASRIGAQRHTQARIQPVKEGVLDSECEGAARRELQRRRVEWVDVRNNRNCSRFQTSLMRDKDQLL